MSFIGGMSRPARGTGLALLAVAVIAAVIGGVTLLTGDGDGGDGGMAGPPAGTSPSADGERGSPGKSQDPGATSAPGTTTSGTPSPDGTSTPGDAATSQPGAPAGNGRDGANGGNGDGGDGTDGEPGGSVNGVSVRVYNNSNVDNLASRAARDLRGQGWQVAEISNYPWGIVPATTAYYRPGTPEKEAALSLASSFGMRAEPRFDGIKDASGGVIIIVTKNYDGPTGKSG